MTEDQKETEFSEAWNADKTQDAPAKNEDKPEAKGEETSFSDAFNEASK